jgi:NADPH2:quinone reductase
LEPIMKAVRVAKFGIENVQVDEVPDVAPGPGELLIATEAATVNPADVALVTGAMASFLPPAFRAPYTPGWDLAGRVVAVGDGGDSSWVGDRVVGFSPWMDTGRGTQAELVALPPGGVAVAPEGLASAQLTTIGLNGLTAWRAIDELDLTPGETLVIAGAAGSVGGFALELAVSRGARVIAAVAESDRDKVLALGATDVAPREAGDLSETVRAIVPAGADAFFDTTRTLGTTGLDAVRDSGRYVTVTTAPEAERDITVTMVYGGPDAVALAALLEMAATGPLHTFVAREFALSDARAAYAEFAARSHSGRIVLTF